MNVFELVAMLKLNTSAYEKGLSDAEKDASSFGSKMSRGLGTAAKVGGIALLGTATASVKLGKTLVDGASELATYGDHVDKMSQKMGISAEAYQEWDAVMQHSGTSIDSMQRGMITLAKAAESNKDEFDKLGISTEELASLSREDLFARTIEGLQGMEEGTERTAIAQALLGGAAKELGPLLNTTAEETEHMKQRAHELGGVISDEAVKESARFKDNLRDLQTALSGTKREIMAETLPAFNDLMDGFTKLLKGEEGADEMLNKGMDELGQAIDNIMPKVGVLLENILPRVLEFGGKILTSLAEQLPGIISAVVKQVPALIKSLIQAITKMIPQLVKAGVDIIKSLAEGMGKGDTDFIDMIIELLDSLIDAILENLPEFIQAGLTIVQNLVLGIMQKLPDLITAAADIIMKLIEGLVEMLPQILEQGKDVVLSIIHGITQNLPKIVQAAVDIIKSLIDTLVKNLPEILTTGMEILLELIQGILDAIPDLVAMLPEIIDTIVTTLLSPEMLAKLLDVGVQLIAKLAEGLLDILNNIGEKADEIVGGIVGAILGLAGSLLDAGAKLMGKFWEGLKEVAAEIYDWATKFIENIKAIFGEAKSGAELAASAVEKASAQAYVHSQEYQDTIEGYRKKYKGDSSTYGGSDYSSKYVAPKTSNGSDYSSKYTHYAKAVDTPYILDGATIFGAMNGSLLEGGERGQEMIVGTDYLASMIQEAYAKANEGSQAQNIIIPVYIGQERITEVVVDAQNRHNYITGGR